MGLRQRKWAKHARIKLLEILGNKCVDCGTTEQLEFDCIIPQGHEHHQRYDTSWRMSFYRKQHINGNLAIRCEKCNNKKAAKEHPQNLDLQDKEFNNYDNGNPF